MRGIGLLFISSRRQARSAIIGTAQLVAFAAFGAPLSYIAATFSLTLQDKFFSRIDQSVMFDWMAVLAWMNAHPILQKLFNAAYLSFTVQASVSWYSRLAIA
jgi:hypothetical protein